MLLKGKPVADKIKEEILAHLGIRMERGLRVPKLAILRVGNNPDDIAYEDRVIKNCQGIGFSTLVKVLDQGATTEQVVDVLKDLNEDMEIDGILVFRPMPKGIDFEKISSTIKAEKDIDGMNPVNMAKVFAGDKKALAPCTAEAVVEILKYYYEDIEGKNIVVVNRSLVLGKPLAMLLLAENATVTLCHSKTENMKGLTAGADIVVTGIGKGKYFGPDFFSKNSIIIDVGINFVDDKMCGDVNFDEVDGKVKAITPVPGGLGTVTSMVLLRNVIKGMGL